MAPARKMIDITNGFLDPDKRRVILIVIFTSFLTISPVGYHLVVLNVPEKVIQSSLNQTFFNEYGRYLSAADMSVLWAFIVSCQGLGALIGCFFIVPMTSYFGTKWAMMTWNNLILIFGSLIMGLSAKIDMFELMFIGRFLTGVYTGLACALVPIFVYEISPKEIRGALSCFMHIFVCVGSALAAILSLNFILGGEDTWGLLLAFPALLGLIQILASPMLPETPSHLLMNGVEDKALQSIKFYHGSGSNLIETMSRYNEQCSEIPQQWSITDSFKNPKARWGIILGMVVSATQIFCGSMATVSYSTSMFESVSFITVLIPYLPAFGSILSAILTLPALYLVETMGRRKLLLSTL
uniref:Major facilitator superfamily (MFS) profile domain-containing protein n=1 Tax=Plectus sambesii TaxID=2011161 RepID=A0A914UMG8_9BILA